jgi:hypothetical protein
MERVLPGDRQCTRRGQTYCHYTHTESEALQEICRVHFPDCRQIDESKDGRGEVRLEHI